MTTLKIFRETALPATLVNDALYVIAPAARPNYIEMYVTNSLGAVRRIIDQIAIQAMITASIQSATELKIVADVAARDALSPTAVAYVYVINATGDSTVASGGATYLYNTANSKWVKVSEAESLDVQLTWSALQNKPTSTVAQIDNAVGLAHTHANKTQLDSLNVDSGGNLLIAGSLTHIGWDSANW